MALTVFVRETCKPCFGHGYRPFQTLPCQDCSGRGYIEREVPELLAAAKEAVETIHAFHGETGWKIYSTHAPEMLRLNAAIAKTEAREA